jgi:hypothetical protein
MWCSGDSVLRTPTGITELRSKIKENGFRERGPLHDPSTQRIQTLPTGSWMISFTSGVKEKI